MKCLNAKWLFIVAFLFCFKQSYAQDAPDRNVFHVQTFYTGNVDGGSFAEFDSLTSLLRTNVLSKRSKIISQRMMNHFWGSDSRQFIIIREFANMEDMNAFYAESTTEFFNAYWDTEEKRTAFNDAYSKYFTGSYHSDEVYREIPGGRK